MTDVDAPHRWHAADLAAEVELLLPGDHPASIAVRLHYKDLGNLCANLTRNGYTELANKLTTQACWVKLGHAPREAPGKRW